MCLKEGQNSWRRNICLIFLAAIILLSSITMASAQEKNKEQLIFSTVVYPTNRSETNALLLVESIRDFAGSLSQAPIWCFVPQYEKQLSSNFQNRLSEFNTTLIPYEINHDALRFFFAADIHAAAIAESMAVGKTDFLIWLSSNTLILHEPTAFLLSDGKDLAYRDDLIVRPYFNAGILITRPENVLFKTWRDTFFKVYQKPELQQLYKQDERYAIFIHQAILSGVILATLTVEEIQELPSAYNYPEHLHGEDITANRPAILDELVTVRHEGFYQDPDWKQKMPASDSLKDWLAERLPQ